eukprot:SAG11_NODE_1125_length_5773_cov_1.928974_3_plen_152_part_00
MERFTEVVPGAHKGNISAPQSMWQFKAHQEFIKQPATKAGDVVIFTEATTHGTLPWTAEHQRHSVLFHYSPAKLAFAGGRHSFDRDVRSGRAWPDSWYDGLEDEQIAVLEPPYHRVLDRWLGWHWAKPKALGMSRVKCKVATSARVHALVA